MEGKLKLPQQQVLNEWDSANGGENPQQEAVNEGDATYPPAAGMEGIRHDHLHNQARRLYSPDMYVHNPRTNPKSTVVC